MRITAAQRAANENRIRAAMDRLLRGEIPPGGRCDVKTLAAEAGVDRTAFYGNRPYAHLRIEFENRLQFSRLVYALDPPSPVRCIVGANETNATFRFHQIRHCEQWNTPDLDSYRQDKMIVVDIEPDTR